MQKPKELNMATQTKYKFVGANTQKSIHRVNIWEALTNQVLWKNFSISYNICMLASYYSMNYTSHDRVQRVVPLGYVQNERTRLPSKYFNNTNNKHIK